MSFFSLVFYDIILESQEKTSMNKDYYSINGESWLIIVAYACK